ncbi:MAG TPA: universal stress protein [Deltaproteobacteria bacterium]|nr:universal stress protein [Deltaproteobacteria bacterium]
MFETILYPTDFSDVAQKALTYIDRLKSSGATTVIIVHVIDARTLDLLVYAPAHYMTIEKDLREDAENKMAIVRKRLEKSGFDVIIRIEIGIPADVILQLEKEEDVSVIVLGSHGKSNIKEMFLGSVSERVIRSALKPVLVVKR